MNVLYDISPLAVGHFHAMARTGVFRYTENLLFELLKLEDVQTTLWSSRNELWNIYGHHYVREHDALESQSLVTFADPVKDRRLAERIMRLGNPPRRRLEGLLSPRRAFSYWPLYLAHRKAATALLQSSGEIDLVHYTYFPSVPEWNGRLRRAYTIYDLVAIRSPELFGAEQDATMRALIDELTPEDVIVCISENTRNDLLAERPDLSKERVFVTPLGASASFAPCTDAARKQAMRKRYGIHPDRPYVLGLATLEPRKNIVQAVRAFAEYVQLQKDRDLQFVLAGGRGWNFDEVFATIDGLGDLRERIVITGYVDDADLAPLYSDALCFVYLSLYEGFGLPVLEAMQCGLPVIASDNSSLPEVVGDAGILVGARDNEAVCAALHRYVSDAQFRRDAAERSLRRASLFSWERCASQTVDAYRTAVNG